MKSSSRAVLWGSILLVAVATIVAGAILCFNAGMIADASGDAGSLPVLGVLALVVGGVAAIVSFLRFATILATQRADSA